MFRRLEQRCVREKWAHKLFWILEFVLSTDVRLQVNSIIRNPARRAGGEKTHHYSLPPAGRQADSSQLLTGAETKVFLYFFFPTPIISVPLVTSAATCHRGERLHPYLDPKSCQDVGNMTYPASISLILHLFLLLVTPSSTTRTVS